MPRMLDVGIRNFKTASSEVRAFYKDKQIKNEYHFKMRNRKSDIDPWNNERQAQGVLTKSWKKLFKRKKQYLKKFK